MVCSHTLGMVTIPSQQKEPREGWELKPLADIILRAPQCLLFPDPTKPALLPPSCSPAWPALQLSHLLRPWSSCRAPSQRTAVLGATRVSDPSRNPGAEERANYGPRIKMAAKQLCRVEGMLPSETHFPIPGLPRMHSLTFMRPGLPTNPDSKEADSWPDPWNPGLQDGPLR